MNKFAVIVAGGNGSRMNSELPKQFMMLKTKPVLYYTLNTFLQSYPDLKIILVLPEGSVTKGLEIIDNYFTNERIRITTGGDTRFHSVQNGLKLVDTESVVFVHDGVRCLLTTELVHRCYKAALEFGAAIPVIESKDSVRVINGEMNEALERSKVKLVQTPQAFLSRILLQSFDQVEYQSKFTDEATVVEFCGIKVSLIDGEVDNIKITRPDDLWIAEKILERRSTEVKNS